MPGSGLLAEAYVAIKGDASPFKKTLGQLPNFLKGLSKPIPINVKINKETLSPLTKAFQLAQSESEKLNKDLDKLGSKKVKLKDEQVFGKTTKSELKRFKAAMSKIRIRPDLKLSDFDRELHKLAQRARTALPVKIVPVIDAKLVSSAIRSSIDPAKNHGDQAGYLFGLGFVQGLQGYINKRSPSIKSFTGQFGGKGRQAGRDFGQKFVLGFKETVKSGLKNALDGMKIGGNAKMPATGSASATKPASPVLDISKDLTGIPKKIKDVEKASESARRSIVDVAKTSWNDFFKATDDAGRSIGKHISGGVKKADQAIGKTLGNEAWSKVKASAKGAAGEISSDLKSAAKETKKAFTTHFSKTAFNNSFAPKDVDIFHKPELEQLKVKKNPFLEERIRRLKAIKKSWADIRKEIAAAKKTGKGIGLDPIQASAARAAKKIIDSGSHRIEATTNKYLARRIKLRAKLHDQKLEDDRRKMINTTRGMSMQSRNDIIRTPAKVSNKSKKEIKGQLETTIASISKSLPQIKIAVDSGKAGQSAASAVKSVVSEAKKGQPSMRKAGDKMGQRLGKGIYRESVNYAKRSKSAIVATFRSAFIQAGGFLTGLAGFRGLMSLGEGIRSLSTDLVMNNAKMEQWNQSLEVLMGDATKATKFMEDLKVFADQTPFELPGLVKGSQRLMQFGFTAEEIPPLLKSIGDAAASAPEGMADAVGRLSLVFGQMRSSGKLNAQDLRQFSEVGIGAQQILEKSFGKTIEDIRKDMESGILDMDDVLEVLVKGMNKRFGGMMDRQSKTMIGLISTIKDLWFQLTSQVGKPIFDSVKDALSVIVNKLRGGGFAEMTKSLKEMSLAFAPIIKDWLKWALDIIPKAIKFIADIGTAIGNFLNTEIGKSITRVGALSSALTLLGVVGSATYVMFAPIIPLFALIASAATSVSAGIEYVRKALSGLDESSAGKALLETWMKVKNQFELLVFNLKTQIAPFFESIGKDFGATGSAVSNVIGFMTQRLLDFLSFIMSVFSVLTSDGPEAWDLIKNASELAILVMKNGLMGLFNGLLKALNGVADKSTGIFGAFSKGVRAVLEATSLGIKYIIKDLSSWMVSSITPMSGLLGGMTAAMTAAFDKVKEIQVDPTKAIEGMEAVEKKINEAALGVKIATGADFTSFLDDMKTGFNESFFTDEMNAQLAAFEKNLSSLTEKQKEQMEKLKKWKQQASDEAKPKGDASVFDKDPVFNNPDKRDPAPQKMKYEFVGLTDLNKRIQESLGQDVAQKQLAELKKIRENTEENEQDDSSTPSFSGTFG